MSENKKEQKKENPNEKSSDTKSKQFMQADEQDDTQISKNKIGDWKSFIELILYAKKYKYKFIIAFLLISTSGALAVYSAKIMGKLVEDGLLKKDLDDSILYAGMILFLEVGSIFIYWFGRKILTNSASKTIYDIRARLFDHLQHLPLGFYDRQPQGRIIVRITHDVEGIEDFFTNSLGRLLNAGIMSTMAMTAMLITDFKLGATLFASMVPAVFFIYFTRERVRKANRRMSKLSAALNSKLAEFLNGLEVIRSFGLEKWSKQEYDKAVDEHFDSQLKANWLFGLTRPFVSLLCSLPLVGLVWFGGEKVLAGAMTVGLFVTFIRYCERFFQPIMTLAREVHVIQQAFTSSERVMTFLKQSTEEIELGEDGEVSKSTNENLGHALKGKIDFKDVWMGYNDDEMVLKGLGFSIAPGEKIGLVGTTGCGKTTTVSLLSRLYDFNSGDITIDDVSIREYQRDFLRAQVGFVSQDAIIFRGSLRENLTADDNLTEEDLINACEQTGLLQVMQSNAMSFESEILEGGSNLSVGERQLVSLTRVLLKNPSILVLDEATANIDPYFEQIIHKAVDKIMENRTCLIIAHRLATLEHCDRILVFESGVLVEEGSKDELYQKKGTFFNLQNAQFTQV